MLNLLIVIGYGLLFIWWWSNTTNVWKKFNFFQNLIFFHTQNERTTNGSVKIDSNLRKVSLLKLSNWAYLPGKIMLCNDVCTTVVFTDFTIFSLFCFEFPAVLIWSCWCCDNVNIVGKRFSTVAADSGCSSFLMFKSTANFNLKKHRLLSPNLLLMKTSIECCEKTGYGESFVSFKKVIVNCCCFWCVYQNTKMVSRCCCWQINFFISD